MNKEKQAVLMEEAIHSNKARLNRRDKLCQKDDCELEEINQQLYDPNFKGIHPIGVDTNEKARKDWIKNKEKNVKEFYRNLKPRNYDKYYIALFWFSGGYIIGHLIVALLKYLIN